MKVGDFLEENKAIVHSLIEAMNEQNLALLDELIAPDKVESFEQGMTMDYKGFPDFYTNIEDIIAEGEKVWFRVKDTGTYTGEYLGFTPTGKKITWTVIDIFHMIDGKIAEGWNIQDELDFLKQLGVIEYKGFPDEVV